MTGIDYLILKKKKTRVAENEFVFLHQSYTQSIVGVNFTTDFGRLETKCDRMGTGESKI